MNVWLKARARAQDSANITRYRKRTRWRTSNPPRAKSERNPADGAAAAAAWAAPDHCFRAIWWRRSWLSCPGSSSPFAAGRDWGEVTVSAFCALFLRGGVKHLNTLHTLEELLLLRCGRDEWAGHARDGRGVRDVGGTNGPCLVYSLPFPFLFFFLCLNPKCLLTANIKYIGQNVRIGAPSEVHSISNMFKNNLECKYCNEALLDPVFIKPTRYITCHYADHSLSVTFMTQLLDNRSSLSCL